ncbi:hypothetical protein N7467_005419 [Penicillium canescens]|nr:hypothetical protein N7467_005419 [Penicillium canescens]
MEADWHQRQMMRPSESGIRPPARSTGPVTSTPDCSTLPEQLGYGLNDDYSWITYNGANLLWLPTDYRPTNSSLFAMSITNLAIACSSGLIIFLALRE